MLNLGPWQFTGEYMTTFLQRDNVTAGTGPDLFFHGAYVYASYFLTGEHMAYSRTRGMLDRVKPFENFFLVERCRGGTGSGWGAWQIAARYDHLDISDADITGGNQQSVTLGLNWYWNAYSKVQTNLVYGDIRERGPIGGFDQGDYWLMGTRFMCDF
jgi:phosphate-selective porin OprO/OprP